MTKKRSGHGKYSTSDMKLTPCVCPRCECDHEIKLFWIGKLPAKKYCKPCRIFKNKILVASTQASKGPTRGIGSD